VAFLGSAKYHLEITTPNGSLQAFETYLISIDRFLANLS